MNKRHLLRGIALPGFLALSLFCTALVNLPVAAQGASAVTMYNQGIDAYNQGNVNKALSLFEKAAATDPNYADAHYNLGSIYYQKAMYAKAEAAFRRVAQLTPNDAQAKYNLALALEKLNRYPEAITYFQQVPSSDRKYGQAQQKIEALKAAQAAAEAAKQAAQPKTDEQRMAEMMAGGKSLPSATLDYSKIAVTPFSKGFFGPTGICIGPEGYLYVANYSKNTIFKVSATGDKTVFAKGEMLSGPIGMVYNPKSNELYVANYLKNNVVRISAQGDITQLAAGLSKPYNLFLDGYNNVLYIGEQESNSLSKIQLPAK